MTDAIKPEDAKPPQNSDLARQHLAILGRDTHHFRTLHDSDRRRPGKTFEGTFEDHMHALRKCNDHGEGVFVMVGASDGRGGKAANVTGHSVFVADLDGAPLENIDRIGLAPHLVLNTSPGKWHAYWRVVGIELDGWTPGQKRLAKVVDADLSVSDMPRVIRLAGFMHMKNPDAPHLVAPVRFGTHPPFSMAEFMAGLAAAEQKQGIAPPNAKPAARKKLPASIAPPADKNKAAEIARAESALRHCIGVGMLDPNAREEWIRMGIALKTTLGEDGFALFVTLSAESDKFESEDDCRKQWVSFKDDRPDGKRLTMASFFAIAIEHGWSGGGARDAAGGSNISGEDTASRGGRGKPDAASIVLDLVEEAGDEIFLDEEGAVYARFPRKADDSKAPNIVAPIDSERYGGILRRRFKLETGNKTLPKEQLANAIALLRAKAVEDDVRRPVHLRVGAHDGRIYVDLSGDGSVVYEVDGVGWRRAADPPVLFVAGSRGALPTPVGGGAIDDLAAHMPNLDLAGRQRVLAFAIGAFNGEGTFPMLLLGGGHGNNKSTIGDMVVALTDPPAKPQGARYSFPADDRDLVIHASKASTLFFDNVSSFGPRESDSLCKVMSGTAFATRKLHTDAEEQRFAMRRPVVATCIGMPTTRGDLLDRTIPVIAEPQPGAKRRTEAAVWAAFRKNWPKLLGLVLTGVSQALRNREIVQARVDAGEIDPPRLMDFAQFVEGAHAVLGLAPGEFCRMLRGEQAGLQAEAAAGDPLGAALKAHFSVRDAIPIDASAVELLAILADGRRDREPGWPSKFKVSSHLERIKPGLADLGIVVRTTKAAGKANVMTFQISVDERFQPGRLMDSGFF